MKELENRYVLHIPLAKFEDGRLMEIDTDELIDDLICRLNLESFYISEAESHYRSRSFDEILITVFADDSPIGEMFSQWFIDNNDILSQEAFAYEHNNRMIIKTLR